MGSLVLDVLRKGIWSSFCGGWYYDPNSATFANTFHLYLFLFFLCFPFSVYVYLPRNVLNWTVYTSVVGIIFITIKFTNVALHRMFDHSECVVEEQSTTSVVAESEKRKSNQKLETQEDEGIELQVFNSDTKRESQVNENSYAIDAVEFADFDYMNAKQDTPVTTSATIDLKVDVHRKNSSDSSDEPSTKNDRVLIVDEIGQEKPTAANESIGAKVIVTTSEEVLIESDHPKSCRKRSLKENASQDVSVAVDSVEENAGRLCERSRQYSVSVTLGEGSGETNTSTDPAPARSMQLNSEYEADANKNANDKGLVFWKEKSNSRRPKIVPLDSPRPGPSRRSSSPLSLYASDIVYPIPEHADEQQYSGLKRSSAHSDDDEDDDDYLPRQDDDDYADIEDLDAELDSSHSPLLAKKPILLASNDDSSPEIPSFNRKKGYVDSLTRKHRQCDTKTSKYANEAHESTRATSSGEKDENSEEIAWSEKSLEDAEHVGPIFKWLFAEGTRSSQDLCRRASRDKMKQHEVKNKFPDIFEATKSRVKFSSAPTLSLISGGPEKQSCHKRQRSGTCSQLEIGALAQPSMERKTSLPETSVAQSTSVGMYTIASVDEPTAESSVPRPTESNEASSSGSNTELSSLLPPPYNTPINSPGSTPYYYSRRTTTVGYNDRSSRNRNRRQARRCRSNIRETFPSSSAPSRTNGGGASVPRPVDSEDILMSTLRDTLRETLHDMYFASKTSNPHVASSHDDTSEGAMHIFQDENGDWMSYTFDERGTGSAVCVAGRGGRRRGRTLNPIEEQNKSCNVPASVLRADTCTMFMNANLRPQMTNTASTSASASTSAAAAGGTSVQNDGETASASAHSQLYQIRENENGTFCFGAVEYQTPTYLGLPYTGQSFAAPLRFNPLSHLPGANAANSQLDVNLEHGLSRGRFDVIADHIEVLEDEKRKRRYYKLGFFPFSSVKIYFDRLSLDALLDYNETYFETIVCVVLAVSVSLLGAVILHLSYYHDIPAFVFCFVMATSHYSLLKSVQPDAASPVHGFNKIVAYSRPVYFILCCSLIVGLHYLLPLEEQEIACPSANFFAIRDPYCALPATHDFLCTFILFFPLFFTLGMFPQVNTFLMYVFEQLDMHVFGGSAVTSLRAASYCVFRSLLAVLLLFGFAYGGLSEPKTSQHILFSIFIALLIVFAFHLSRSTCDPTPVWNILVKQFWPIDELTKRSNEVRKARMDKKTTTQLQQKKKKRRPKKKVSVTYGNEIKVEAVDDPKETSVRVSISQQSTDEADPDIPKKKSVLDEDLESAEDTLSAFMQKVFNSRLQSDLIVSCTAGILLFSIHRSTIFTVLQPDLNPIMWSIACSMGFLLHYIVPQLRKPLPWLCISRPLLRSVEHEMFEAQAPATVTWFEKLYLYFSFVEKNIIYPLMFIGCVTSDGPALTKQIGPLASSVILTVCGLKCLRLSYSHISCQYLILAFTVLCCRWEYTDSVFVVNYFVISILYYKIYDLLLKVQFVLTYIAPWQITWGSAFHAFAQPFSLPHSAMMFAQAALSAVLSSPLYPFLGSAIFLTSYPRPVKFWERDYNTRRVDHSNTKMASHLERNLGCDDNNLNSIFYEHLTRSLQRSLCGDLLMGRWGEVSAGDCYILASDYLNCLIHIVELGNGLVTFQMRGLEFRGTYCQQREVEAITDGVEENDGCCCCKPGHLPYMLSLNAAFSQRWLAWEVTSAKYILEGYSISDNSAASMLQVFDFRKMLISYYVKSIVYYAVSSPKLEEWISSPAIRDALQPLKDKNFVDLDPVFNMNIDEDYDYRYSGITRNSFCGVYMNWIRFCNSQRKKAVADTNKDSPLVTLCFALSLLGRRTLGTASHNTAASVEFFLYGVHTLFKGDFRIASIRDEWVFMDMELLRKVVAPAIRMSLKLHQDHFMSPDEYECPPALYTAISAHEENIVISHEGDPVWRKAVLSGMPSLLALRRVMEEGSDDYKIIMLTKRFLSFRVIKMNRECVRGLWAGQQQELVFLRNLNPERGSIQNAKQALRNIINSSCDQPIGYPIFVSPLTTSYAETNAQYTSLLGGAISVKSIKNFVFNFCSRVRKRCVEGCSSGSSAHSQDDGGFGHEGVYSMTTFNVHSSSHQSMETSITGSGGTITRVSTGSGMQSRLVPSPAGPSKPGFVKLTDLLSPPGNNPLPEAAKTQERKTTDKEEEEKEPILHRVKIIDPGQVHDGINQGRLIDVMWPDEIMRQRGGRNFWRDWVPEAGMEGQVVHRWIPNHPNPNKRSTFDRTILLIKIDDKYVPISENGVQDLGAEV